jgi:hypothetical protein
MSPRRGAVAHGNAPIITTIAAIATFSSVATRISPSVCAQDASMRSQRAKTADGRTAAIPPIPVARGSTPALWTR